jgi:hypothetical protein
MTSSLSSKPSQARRISRRRRVPERGAHRPPAPRRAAPRRSRLLGRYIDSTGGAREVVAKPGTAGSVLVVDRDAATRGDRRLIAHLAADEPAENAALLTRHYIAHASETPCRCRPLTAQDARTVPFAEEEERQLATAALLADSQPIDEHGNRYGLHRIQTSMSIPELRWRRSGADESATVISVREAVASFESYEPICGLTLRMLARHADDADVSTSVLRGELTRVQNSPIVLNRALREAVLARIEQQHLSMSEIAIRCGRVKRDRKGNESGETSWLARRLGLLPEAGQVMPTPWVHSDVLALIARRGLGISPREVELT